MRKFVEVFPKNMGNAEENFRPFARREIAPTGFPGGAAATASGSTGMRYLVQQLLMSDGWTMTPDTWAANEMQARTAIEAGMAALLDSLTEIPTI